jgi:SAM-dependent methyltransferase
MPTLAENKDLFDSLYDWSAGGEEWSQWWGMPNAQWAGSLYPRIFPFLKGRILEIAPGHGRWTQFLRDHCTSLIGVDLASSCVNECRRKFQGDPRLHFEVGDGRKLPMVANSSIDFAFSFDSLVHVEADILESYTAELARVLKPNAIAFLHHSNLAELSPWGPDPFVNSGWRGRSVGAKTMRGFVERTGMSCAQQELIPWGDTPFFMDCISTIINSPNQPCVILENKRFMEEAAAIRRISELAKLSEA